jgi:hypothetical protein
VNPAGPMTGKWVFCFVPGSFFAASFFTQVVASEHS